MHDGNVSDAEEEDIEVVPDKVDNTEIEGLKPAEAGTGADKKVPEATNKGNGDQTLKSMDKKPVKNTATELHLDLKMVQSAMIGISSQMVKRTSIPRTISPFIAFRGQAEYLS